MPLSEPPRNPDGSVEPHDHAEILNDDWLIRRVSAEWVVSDPKVPGNARLSTRAFDLSSPEFGGGMSVDIQKLIEEAGVNVVDFVTSPRWTASLRIQTANLRAQQLQVGYSPVAEEPPMPANPYHGEAWGRLTRGQKNELLRQSQWLVEIPGCNLAA